MVFYTSRRTPERRGTPHSKTRAALGLASNLVRSVSIAKRIFISEAAHVVDGAPHLDRLGTARSSSRMMLARLGWKRQRRAGGSRRFGC